MQLEQIGFAGEVRFVVTKSDGSTKIDTGYQKNLILNQGLEFFGGNRGASINSSCVIGSGNSTPTITQTVLDGFVAIAEGTNTTSDYSYVDKGDNLYRMWEQKRYRFIGLDNVNISEVGLVSSGTTSANYYLTTRALIKDSSGAPTSISIRSGETLDIYYKIHKVIDTSDRSFVVNMLDGNGGAIPYNAVIRPYAVGTEKWNSKIAGNATDSNWLYYSPSSNLSDFISSPSFTNINANLCVTATYVENSHKIITNNSFRLSDAVSGVRLLVSGEHNFYCYQVRYGAVSNDASIPKTANDTLSIPIEISWSRYEGVL